MSDVDPMAWRSQLFNLSGMSSPVEIVDQIIGQGIRLKASDILLEPQEKEVLVRFRVDGVLHAFGSMPFGAYDQVLSRIKVLGNMDVAENRKPQESKIRFEVDSHAYVLRAAIISSHYGQMAALRVLDMPQFSEFESMGMSAELASKVKSNISGRYGLFLVCGPTGAGKTTTVHACLKQLNTGEANIMTIEDPVEYVMAGLNQIEDGSDVGLDFASGLRVMLRLNPDVIFVGEIRDADTAKIAIQASLTGHLVISTVHSRNAVGALYRLMDLGIDRYMINYALRGILAQRLMRRVCDQCGDIYQPTPQEIDFYTLEKGSPPGVLKHGQGCEACHQTKYNGRVGIYELLEMDDDVRNLISAGTGETQFRDELKKKGFSDMNQEGVALVDSGITSIAEYMRTVYDAR